ncbi:MAG TPA: aspartate 1-decarboxylase [Chromatiaceae bacterium]|jgi:aspartate 1-decarboxylase|nr:aspartate 1-decarboxylase [Chromatiaceae bacterium]HIB84923.1 aspartate 1-decarboxylase [Chromatiaceae bacterium]HIN82949.1 aspartate 1-decarboxylase [Chromatiales bacterium]HIO15146.1 aspartate 1-decarboxylase [Chromatiales bacterium]HIO54570.1 aspartate 1-decarboxylase [Chromatiales bacterium]
MQCTLLKSKLHHARVTHSELDYEGSCAIDSNLLEAAGIREYEQIQIYNLANGERFTTYAIQAEAGSRIISVNGAAAHKASPGDSVIICAYGVLNQQEMAAFKPSMVYLDEHNNITRRSNSIPIQVA